MVAAEGYEFGVGVWFVGGGFERSAELGECCCHLLEGEGVVEG